MYFTKYHQYTIKSNIVWTLPLQMSCRPTSILFYEYFEPFICTERLPFIYSDGSLYGCLATPVPLQHQYRLWGGAGNGHPQSANDQQCSFSGRS